MMRVTGGRALRCGSWPRARFRRLCCRVVRLERKVVVDVTARKRHEAEPEVPVDEDYPPLVDYPSAATVAPPATPQEIARSQGREWFRSTDDPA